MFDAVFLLTSGILTFHNSGARKTIYILDWWLSPELYLRRPPSKNAQYRLDAMLKAAAERGITVNIIVYKEVQAALTLDSAVSTISDPSLWDYDNSPRIAHETCS